MLGNKISKMEITHLHLALQSQTPLKYILNSYLWLTNRSSNTLDFQMCRNVTSIANALVPYFLEDLRTYLPRCTWIMVSLLYTPTAHLDTFDITYLISMMKSKCQIYWGQNVMLNLLDKILYKNINLKIASIGNRPWKDSGR